MILLPLISLCALCHAEDAPGWKFDRELLKPFWLTTKMYGESVLFVQEKEGALGTAPLLFKPLKILSVQSSSGQIVYQEGLDYLVNAGQELMLPPGSRIPFRTQPQLRAKPGTQQFHLTHRDGNGEILFGAKHEYQDMQVCVTYSHAPDEWKGDKPDFAGDRLPKTLAKLRDKKALTIALLGDSISTGCNASKWADTAPFQPAWQDLLVMNLESVYGLKISLKNFAVGGTDTNWGVANIGKVVDAKPDLVILAFGMNDSGGRDAASYGANMKKMADAVQPAEVILVASMLGNADWTYLKMDRFPQYRDELKKLCKPGVVLADMTALWSEMLVHKRYLDQTGNGVNHPNDFGHRLYAQVFSALLINSKEN